MQGRINKIYFNILLRRFTKNILIEDLLKVNLKIEASKGKSQKL
jgi:hypothetical protein